MVFWLRLKSSSGISKLLQRLRSFVQNPALKSPIAFFRSSLWRFLPKKKHHATTSPSLFAQKPTRDVSGLSKSSHVSSALLSFWTRVGGSVQATRCRWWISIRGYLYLGRVISPNFWSGKLINSNIFSMQFFNRKISRTNSLMSKTSCTEKKHKTWIFFILRRNFIPSLE